MTPPYPFDVDKFVDKFVNDLSFIQDDMNTLRKLPEKQMKDVLKKVMNKKIDIPGMPEFLEAIAFSFIVEASAYVIERQFGGKKN